MSDYFLDTSALGKRYIVEVGSGWITGLTDPSAGHAIIISELTLIEMTSILARRHRQGVLSATDFTNLHSTFLIHAQQEYQILDIDHLLVLLAQNLVKNHPLRSLDAIQLASALVATQILGTIPTFISADQNLLKAAEAEGFPIDDPNTHP